MTGAGPTPRRVLLVHNRYREPGGEDAVFEHEAALLRSAGCEVETLEVSNDAIGGPWSMVGTALGAVYSRAGRRLVESALARFRPDILHVHNFFPRLSPSLFDACAAAGVPAVWTLHNYRLACANGLLFRDGRVCEDCVGRVPIPAIRHRCYRGSMAGSAAVVAMILAQRARGTWHGKVARFIALTEFSRDLMVRAGLPADRLSVKPNSVVDPLLCEERLPQDRSGAVFVGRLSAEKGAAVMVEAWHALPHIALTVVGDGPERAALERAAPANVTFLGFRQQEDVRRAIAGAKALIVPSLWYENCPMVVVEAMALATPVIASRIGALGSLVRDGENGMHFEPGNPVDLACVVRSAFGDPAMLRVMGGRGRAAWAETMAPGPNLDRLFTIYREAMAT